MFGTKRSQGIDIPSISVTQTVQHVQAIIRHGHQSSPSHDLHLHNMEAMQCHLGSEIPFWELPFELYGNLAPEGSMKFTWQHLSPTSLTLRGSIAVVTPKRQRDVFVMDVLVLGYGKENSGPDLFNRMHGQPPDRRLPRPWNVGR